MAKKSGGPNKSVAIRTYKANHQDEGPKAIAEALGKEGIKVTPAFVSTVLSNAKRKGGKGRRGRKPGPRGGAADRTLHDLKQAKKLADKFGGVEHALKALNALATLLD
jgi:hypothetical protein